MACVDVTNVQVLDNPAYFHSPFQFEIQFNCTTPIADDIEWKLTYVGSSESEEFDQVLDSVLVGPVAVGQYKIVFQAEPPQVDRIPPDDLLGVTVILLSCYYRDREFIRIGFYVNTEYEDPELRDNPPAMPDLSKMVRNILSDKPRVTRYQIEWQ